MCLLSVLFRTRPDAPLVVAANRDEMLDRPARPTDILQMTEPRIVGGRDLLAGGTWLAVNEHGVFAGLTNRPTVARDPMKKSRGALPLALTQHRTARAAIAAFHERPSEFSPAWLFVGDRESLFLVDMTAGERANVRELPPGIHILENRAYGVRSAKVARVSAALAGADAVPFDDLVPRLTDVLRDHVVPDGVHNDDSGVAGFIRPRETEAACVHAGPYGTRSACIIVVPPHGPARVWSSDGPPCTNALRERSLELWDSAKVHA